jgi:hypothetical protein
LTPGDAEFRLDVSKPNGHRVVLTGQRDRSLKNCY